MIQAVPKINKKVYLPTIGMILVLVILLGLFYFGEKVDWFGKKESLPPVDVLEENRVLTDRGEVFSISGAEMTPDFINELIIDPFYEAELGEKQYFSVWVEDAKGVESVKVIVRDFKIDVATVDLMLEEGDNNNGRWEGIWTIDSVTSGTAPTLIFQAQNREGEIAEIETYFYVKEAKQSWLREFFGIKPVFAAICFPFGNTSGYKLISGCSISAGTTVGTDTGNLTISGTVTMEQNSTILFESGYKIEFGTSGKILKSKINTKIEKGDVVVATPTFALSVFKSGTGLGAVAGPGINCGTDCSESYTTGTTVTLFAGPAPGSTFVGWSGACSGTGNCTVTMNSSKSVTATFNTSPVVPTTYTLSVFKSGTGSGTVVGPGINCGSDCSESYAVGTSVTLTASPNSGSTFIGWSGACSGTGSCSLVMNSNKSVTATFNTRFVPPPTTYILSVSKSGTGLGAVAGPGINCGTDCSESYTAGTRVTLIAGPASGSTFVGWSGACSGTGNCTVTMNNNKSVTARFNTSAPATTCTGMTISSNPFCVSTTFRAIGSSVYKAQATVYNLNAKVVWTSSWKSGTDVRWTGVNNSGQQLARGGYLVLMAVQDSDGRIISCGTIKISCQLANRDGDGDGYINETCMDLWPRNDCCDSDSRVYLGSSNLSGYANNCGDFDYNCDGAETKIYTISGNCSCSGRTFTGTSGWDVSYIPNCGASRTFIFSGSCRRVLWWWRCDTGALRQVCY